MNSEAIRIIRIMLGSNTSVRRDEIEVKVNQLLEMPDFSDCDKDQLIREIESIYNVRVEDFRIIEREDRRKPWLSERRAVIDWGFWSRYKGYLQDEKNFAPDTLIKLDRLTDRILDGLFDPVENLSLIHI